MSVVDDLMLVNARLCIPRGLRRKILERLHIGHQRVVWMTRRARDSVWWPSVRQEVARMVEDCSSCIRERRITHQPLPNTKLPTRAWEEITVDLFELAGKHFTTLSVDYFSIKFQKLSGRAGWGLVRKAKQIFAWWGYAEAFRSENGPCFVSQEWRSPMEDCGAAHLISSLPPPPPGYPESNGLGEKAVQTVNNSWRRGDNRYDGLLAYRISPLEHGTG